MHVKKKEILKTPKMFCNYRFWRKIWLQWLNCAWAAAYFLGPSVHLKFKVTQGWRRPPTKLAIITELWLGAQPDNEQKMGVGPWLLNQMRLKLTTFLSERPKPPKSLLLFKMTPLNSSSVAKVHLIWDINLFHSVGSGF